MTEENLIEICFDTETTGLDPRDGHKVIEIGCVELINKVKTEPGPASSIGKAIPV